MPEILSGGELSLSVVDGYVDSRHGTAQLTDHLNAPQTAGLRSKSRAIGSRTATAARCRHVVQPSVDVAFLLSKPCH